MVVPNVQKKLAQSKEKQASYYDRSSKELAPLHVGDIVRVRPTTGKRWFRARVDSQVDVRPYKVCTQDGAVYRRNRRLLYKVNEPFLPQEDH